MLKHENTFEFFNVKSGAYVPKVITLQYRHQKLLAWHGSVIVSIHCPAFVTFAQNNVYA